MKPKRTRIIEVIQSKLEAVGFFVSRKLYKLSELRADQFPAISVTDGPERDSPGTQSEVKVLWELSLVVYVEDQAKENPAGSLDEKMALVVRTLCEDPTLSGLVDDIDIIGRDTDRGIFFPFASAVMNFRIQYFFDRITEGG